MSGRLTLAATGIQDRWLTEEPQYSHFLSRFRRHTKFSFEQIEVPFQRFEEYGNETTARIPNNAGDLLKGLTLNMDLPPPSPLTGQGSTYTLAGGSVPGSLELNGSSTSEANVYQGVEYIFNSTEEFQMSNVGVNDYTSEDLGGGNYRITLNIQVNIVNTYSDAKIELVSDTSKYITLNVKQIRWDASTPTKMIKYADILIGGQTIQRITGEYIYMYNQLNYTQNDADFTLVATSLHNSYPIVNDAVNPQYTDFQKYKVQLPFYFHRHPSLALPTCGLSSQLVEIKLKFRPVDELVVEYDLNTTTYSTTSISCEVQLRNMSLYTEFVYITDEERSFILTRPIEYVITQTQLAEINMDPGVSKRSVMVNFEHPVKELFFIATNDTTHAHVPIKHVNLKFNNNTVIDADNLQLSAEQPIRHHTNSISEDYEFGVYSFSLRPEVYYPTGQVNMSRVIHKLLEVELTEPNVLHNHTLRVYASNYNVLRVSGGIAGLKF
jgi:hypothetical protein